MFTSVLSTEAQTSTEIPHVYVMDFASKAKEIKVCKVRMGPGGLESGITSGTSVPVTGKDAESLRGLLVNPASYEEGGHRCVFAPGYKITLVGDKKSMDVYLCYGCHDYLAAINGFYSQPRSFAPSAKAIKEILDRLNLKEP